jgi:hypothetical protein
MAYAYFKPMSSSGGDIIITIHMVTGRERGREILLVGVRAEVVLLSECLIRKGILTNPPATFSTTISSPGDALARPII